MSMPDESVWISYNGELYDYREHRQTLRREGYQFRSECDTEVVLYLYHRYGLDFLQKLNGIFALALWDARHGELILARDHAGIKPLYYSVVGQSLFFASEVKALLQAPRVPREINYRRLPELLQFLWIPGPETMFRGIHKLEPGHYLVYRAGRVEDRQWFHLDYQPDHRTTASEWQEQARATLQRVVRRQMVSDVPLGAFLSGGVDSSSIVALMRRCVPDKPIDCFTAQTDAREWGPEGHEDDYPYARRVAELFGAELSSIPLRPKLMELLPKIVWHLDEPDADPAAIPSYLICQLAREKGMKVLLSGTGGDEVFFGYRSHVAYRRYAQLQRLPRRPVQMALALAEKVASVGLGARHVTARRLRKFGAALGADGLARHLSLVEWSSPDTRTSLFSEDFLAATPGREEIPECLRRYYAEFQGEGELNRHTHLLVQTFLGAHNFLYTDKTSMATSVEVRVPFLDVELMRLCARMPENVKLAGSMTKAVLKRAMVRDLPAAVLHRAKVGFGVPLRRWITGQLDEMVRDLLSEERVRSRGLFSPAAIRTVVADNRAQRADHAYLIYNLINLELWLQCFIDRPPHAATP